MVREAVPRDAEGIAQVHVRTWRAAYAHAFPQSVLDGLSFEENAAHWRGRIAAGDTHTFVSEQGGRIVGFANCGASEQEPAIGELYAIYVLPEAWGGAAARELVAAAEAVLADAHSEAILWVLADNPRARRFYEREGWRPDGEGRQLARGVEVDVVRYRKELRSGPGS